MSLPTITVIGNVKFMETKFTQSGTQVTSLVVSASDKNKDGNYDNLNIKAEFWGKQAEFVNQYFNDGDVIIVTGRLITNSWTDQNGGKRHEIKFHFPSASFPPKARQQQAQPQQYQQPQQQQPQQYQQPQQQQPQQKQQPQQQQHKDNQQPQQPMPQQPQPMQQQLDMDTEEIPF